MSNSIRSMRKSRAHIRKLAVHSIRVRRTNKQFYADIISPDGIVLTGISTLNPELSKLLKGAGGNKDAAAALAVKIKDALDNLGVKKVAFDRSGYIYHGRVKAFAEALRTSGVIV
ncbi:MAG: 50S ribosomal protein L18 [Pseudomonadota bacterium]|nr:50S ribosomal protein L18 [Pseudomonadota bacterium]